MYTACTNDRFVLNKMFNSFVHNLTIFYLYAQYMTFYNDNQLGCVHRKSGDFILALFWPLGPEFDVMQE